jgi:hypothetical protein
MQQGAPKLAKGASIDFGRQNPNRDDDRGHYGGDLMGLGGDRST